MSQAPLPTTLLPEAVQKAITDVALDDRFTLPSGRMYMNGSHALLPARRAGWQEHGRLHQWLSRLATRRD